MTNANDDRLARLQARARGMGLHVYWIDNELHINQGHVRHVFPIRDKDVLPSYNGLLDKGGTEHSLKCIASLLDALSMVLPEHCDPDIHGSCEPGCKWSNGGGPYPDVPSTNCPKRKRLSMKRGPVVEIGASDNFGCEDTCAFDAHHCKYSVKRPDVDGSPGMFPGDDCLLHSKPGPGYHAEVVWMLDEEVE